ncbi:hypothetical protein Tco_0140362 [Tanacetum coccineum]
MARSTRKSQKQRRPKRSTEEYGGIRSLSQKRYFLPTYQDSERDPRHGKCNFPEPSPLIETPEKQNLNKFCDYHGDRGHNTNDCYQLKRQIEEVVASGKLAHLVKNIIWNNQWNRNQGRNGVKVDYSSLNKACAKDMYPFPEEGEELASLMGYPYKCFLRLRKEYNQIRMAEIDEEKSGFIWRKEYTISPICRKN